LANALVKSDYGIDAPGVIRNLIGIGIGLEILRVLKPGGKALVSDFIKTREYAEVFRAAGAKAKIGGRHYFTVRIVEVEK
jgi:hypothetical protein